MSKYLVKLLPLGKFFFGGDMTFKVNDKETAFSSYIIHSFMMPQQTSILGMMRFLILSNNTEAFDRKGNCIKDVNKAKVLIGEKGFSVDPSNHSRRDYQSVQEIGACFLWNTDKNKPFFKGAKDIDLQIGKESVVNATINMIPVRIPKIDIKKGNETQPFTGKDYLNNYYISLDGEKLNESQIFKEDTRIGINKSYTGKTESEAFYKQVSYRLKENFCFAFEVEVVDSIDLTVYNKQVVKLGADDSSFVFEAERIEKVDYPVSKEDLRVVLRLNPVRQHQLSLILTQESLSGPMLDSPERTPSDLQLRSVSLTTLSAQVSLPIWASTSRETSSRMSSTWTSRPTSDGAS